MKSVQNDEVNACEIKAAGVVRTTILSNCKVYEMFKSLMSMRLTLEFKQYENTKDRCISFTA